MKKNLKDRISCILACCVLLVFGLLSFISVIAPDKEYSDSEGRELEQFSAPGYQELINGEWGKSLESYLLDQFPLRDRILKSYFGVMDLAGVYERNEYVRGKNDTILTVYEAETNKQLEYDKEEEARGGLDAIKILKKTCDDKRTRLISLQIPHKDEFYSDCYPFLYQDGKSNKTVSREYFTKCLRAEGFDVLDVENVIFSHRDEYLYYHLDNHYTCRGAYYTYIELLNHINETYGEALFFPEWDDCGYYRSDRRLNGGFLRVFGDSGLLNSDYLEYVIPKDMPDYTRLEDGIESDKLLFNQEKAGYSLFMSGNCANTVVKTGRPELPDILYIGYSYTNALEAMSVYSFNEMHSIDPRRYKGSISEYIRKHDLEYVVLVRNDLRTNNENIISPIE